MLTAQVVELHIIGSDAWGKLAHACRGHAFTGISPDLRSVTELTFVVEPFTWYYPDPPPPLIPWDRVQLPALETVTLSASKSVEGTIRISAVDAHGFLRACVGHSRTCPLLKLQRIEY